jgi:Ca-activated chloride channel family protein
MRYLLFSSPFLFCVFIGCGYPTYYSQPAPQLAEVQGEEYDSIVENEFFAVSESPLSTFSIDVDGASYSNIRRMINDGYLPPTDAVRIEEMINYFGYNYNEPSNGEIFSISTEVAPAPWNTRHQIVQIGIKGEELHLKDLPPSNLVFLLDVSGSMQSYDKLPLLKSGFRLLVEQLREDDQVAIVVYAGSSGVVLEPTSGSEKEKIIQAIENLEAGGSTAGAQGIERAYDLAKEMYEDGANNRVILATDGDFNVGISSDDKLVRLIEGKRDEGVFLSVLGFGTGNLQDSKMEKIANHGNGNYYYIDSILEAKKVMVSEFGGTMFTIAKDVKIQVEFNPANVESYRLIGYENRILEARDFNDDTKDAGELGSGHTVTALYEIVPKGVGQGIDPLKYQTPKTVDHPFSDEILTLKMRFKQPDSDQSMLVSEVVRTTDVATSMSSELSFASSVAGFGMLLRDSQYKGETDFELILDLAQNGILNDENGYRSEYLRLVQHAELLYPVSQ